MRKYGAELVSTFLFKTMRKLELEIFMGKFPLFEIKKDRFTFFLNKKIMTKVIIASVIIASVTIMASVTYGKCDLWRMSLMASVTYGKGIMASVIMANETEPY